MQLQIEFGKRENVNGNLLQRTMLVADIGNLLLNSQC